MTSTEDRVSSNLKEALELKEAGNKLFAAKEYQKAIGKYTKVFAYASGLKMPSGGGPESLLMSGKAGSLAPVVSKQQGLDIDQVQLIANLNIAACYLQMKDGPRALKFAEKAIALDKTSVKGITRRGRAWHLIGDYSNAERDLLEAAKLDPKDKTIVQSLEAARAKVKAQEAAFAKKVGGFFNRTAAKPAAGAGTGASSGSAEAGAAAGASEGKKEGTS